MQANTDLVTCDMFLLQVLSYLKSLIDVLLIAETLGNILMIRSTNGKKDEEGVGGTQDKASDAALVLILPC